MSYLISLGERVVPVYGDESADRWLGMSKILRKNCIVPEICPIPKFAHDTRVGSMYRYSPFTKPITYMDKNPLPVGMRTTMFSGEFIRRTCFGFLFKYTP